MNTENLSMTVKAHYSVPVGDTPEFIRNVNMVEDFMEVTGASGAITDMTDKVTGFLRDDD